MKVFGTDCLPVPIHKALMRFTPNKCPSLKDKPKIFFVQACQGGRRDDGKLAECSRYIEHLCFSIRGEFLLHTNGG